MVRLFLQGQGSRNRRPITDGMTPRACPTEGTKLGDLDVDVANGRCTSAGSPGVLAGSVPDHGSGCA